MTEWEKFERMVSLKSETVELNNMKEVDNLIKQGNSEFDNATSSTSKAKAILQDVKTGYRQSAIRYNEALKSAELVVSKAKELGLETPSLLETKISWLKENIKEATAKISAIQSAEKNI